MKFFCIGAFRSGTTSTREYLESLGMRAVDWSVIANNYNNYPKDMVSINKTLDKYDIFSDIPYSYIDFMLVMMKRYPDALFFLSTRDDTQWLESVKRHRAVRIEGVSNLITKETLKEVGIVGSSDEELRRSYIDRNSRVVKMFEEANQLDRLCTFDIGCGDMKNVIDEFLVHHGCEINKGVDSFFPWAEKTQ